MSYMKDTVNIEHHAWDKDKCKVCGMDRDVWLNETNWNALFCPGGAASSGSSNVSYTNKEKCCKNSIPIYLAGSWFCETCGAPQNDMKAPDYFSAPTIRKGQFEIEKTCTCVIDQLMRSGCKCGGK